MNTLVRHSQGTRASSGPARAVPMRGCLRLCVGLALLSSMVAGGFLFVRGPSRVSQDEPGLDGTWELSSVKGDPPGSGDLSGIEWQRVAFRNGAIRGETMVQSSEGSPLKLPFPDESVDRVVRSADDTGFRVLWSGSYQSGSGRVLTIHIGKAVYFLKASSRESSQSVEFDQDPLLTVHGSAIYRRAVSTWPHRPRHGTELFHRRPR